MKSIRNSFLGNPGNGEPGKGVTKPAEDIVKQMLQVTETQPSQGNCGASGATHLRVIPVQGLCLAEVITNYRGFALYEPLILQEPKCPQEKAERRVPKRHVFSHNGFQASH